MVLKLRLSNKTKQEISSDLESMGIGISEEEAKYYNGNKGEKPDFMDYADSCGKYSIFISK